MAKPLPYGHDANLTTWSTVLTAEHESVEVRTRAATALLRYMQVGLITAAAGALGSVVAPDAPRLIVPIGQLQVMWRTLVPLLTSPYGTSTCVHVCC